MDWLSSSFIGLVLVLGGVIAYFADWLGRKLGKKRLTLFGRRPRTTAAALTVLAGILIPLITILVLWFASSDFRQWLTEGRRAIGQVKILEQGVKDKTEQIRQKSQQLSSVDAQLVASQAKLTQLAEQVKKSVADAKQANILTQLARMQGTKLLKQIGKQKTELASIGKNLRSANDRLVAARENYGRLNTSFAELQKQIKEQYGENQRLLGENEKIGLKNKDLSASIEKLNDAKNKLSNEILAARSELETAKSDRDAILGQLQDKQALLTKLDQQLQEYVSGSRTQPMIFNFGEEIARIQLPSNLTAIEARAAIRRIEINSSYVADQRGARPLPSGGLSAGLYEVRDQNGKVISVDAQEEAMAKAITGSKDELVLIAYSFANAFLGEYVSLNIRPYRNPVVFHRGELVAETKIDGSLSEDSIFHQVTNFLMSSVRPAAQKKGLIPVRGKEDSIGTVPSDQMLALVKQITDINRTFRLQAIAAQDTKAADSLKLEFKFR